ncbi:hypothetical protein HYR99_06075 [Candidatus Poribacteria bacterium]|nr:hypothetical protein [Candidatus Poribacteria bacterium]
MKHNLYLSMVIIAACALTIVVEAAASDQEGGKAIMIRGTYAHPNTGLGLLFPI